MKIGTKSVLFGVHQFAIHPVLIAYGWYRAFGFRRVWIGDYDVPDIMETMDGWQYPMTRRRPFFASLFDPRLWAAFVVHDLGYVGLPNMDGPEGETHPEFGARVMRRLFGDPWGDLCLFHSRYYAKKLGREPSPLCIADKWVILLEPSWLYLPRARASGELAEFLAVAKARAEVTMANDQLKPGERAGLASGDARQWHRELKSYMRRWIAEHADGQADTWTRVRHE